MREEDFDGVNSVSGSNQSFEKFDKLKIIEKIPASKFAIKNWERIRMGIGNEILLESCSNSFEEQGWLHSIKQTLDVNEMSHLYDELPNTVYPFIHKKIFEKIIFIKHHLIKSNWTPAS